MVNVVESRFSGRVSTESARPGSLPEGATSTLRALRVLDCFTARTPRLTLSEIARLLRQPVSSTHRQIRELCRWGALERGADGRYSIGLHLWEVGSLSPRSKSLREAALPFLQDLYAATHQNVQVAVLDGAHVVYIERIFGHDAPQVIARPGARLPFHVTAVGRVLAAHAPTPTVARLLATPMHKLTPYTTVDPNVLRREFAEIRLTGHAITSRQVELDLSSVAAPIQVAGQVSAALSIITREDERATRRFVPAVVAAAHGVSRMLTATTG